MKGAANMGIFFSKDFQVYTDQPMGKVIQKFFWGDYTNEAICYHYNSPT